MSRDTYHSWYNMLRRCLNTDSLYYYNYGGRGIKICQRWMKFANFLEDMGEKPKSLTLDRINNDGNYEPGNCRWATRAEQNRNKRAYRSNGHLGMRHSEETKAKLRAKRKLQVMVPYTEERRRKISEANRRRWKNKVSTASNQTMELL